MGALYLFLVIAMFIGIKAGLFLVFKKAGIAPWKALIPGVNYWETIVLVGKPKWWIIWFFVPVVNLVIPFILAVEICKSFGRHSFKDHTLCLIAPYAYYIWLGLNKDDHYLGTVPQLKEDPKHQANFEYPKYRTWADAVVFALVAATFVRWFVVEAYKIPTPSMEDSMMVGDHLFVSKFHYGPRVPQTPLAIPLFHHTIPGLNTKAYLDWISLPYYRFPGFEEIERNDILVFNFPVGDTVVKRIQERSFYQLKREGYNFPDSELDVRPLDKKENYVKRCVAIAGDTLEIKNGNLLINNSDWNKPEDAQKSYCIQASKSFTPESVRKFKVSGDDFITSERLKNEIARAGHPISQTTYFFPLNVQNKKKMEAIAFVDSIMPIEDCIGERNYSLLYPHDPIFSDWTERDFGPIWIPKAGESIQLDARNWSLYEWVIDRYEHNSAEEIQAIRTSVQNGEQPMYTFKQDYYWLMGDNRNNSLDSRYWGFVPEDHVVGKPWFVWYSIDPDAEGFLSFLTGVRWNRIFKFL